MVRRALSSALVAAFVLAGFAAVVAAPAGAAKKPPKTTATTLLTDKQYSQSDCEAILAVGDKVQSASGTKFNPQQLADLAKGYEQTAGTVSDQDLKTNLLAIAKIYAAAANQTSTGVPIDTRAGSTPGIEPKTIGPSSSSTIATT